MKITCYDAHVVNTGYVNMVAYFMCGIMWFIDSWRHTVALLTFGISTLNESVPKQTVM